MKTSVLLFSLASVTAAHAQADKLPSMPPVQAQTPEQAAKSFQLPPGYRMELVLSEPQITDPVVTAFDGNGRMFVAEMRTYMQDIDGNGHLRLRRLPHRAAALGRMDRHRQGHDPPPQKLPGR
jgi:hypothetical protein